MDENTRTFLRLEKNQATKKHSNGLIAFDTETTGLAWKDEAFCLTVAQGEEGEYIDLTEDNGVSIARHILRDKRWIIFNAKFDLHKLIKAGVLKREDINLNSFEDVQIISHLHNEHLPLALKKLTKIYLKIDTTEEEDLKRALRANKLTKADGYHLLPKEVLKVYAIKDSEYTYALYQLLRPKIKDQEAIYQIEKAVVLVLLDVETSGLKVDRKFLNASIKTLNKEILKTEIEIDSLVGREDFNPNSHVQVKAAFQERGIILESTDKGVLSSLDHPLAKLLLSLRENKKMVNTYLLNIKKELDVNSNTPTIHSNFKSVKPVTGRMAGGGVEK